MLSKKAHFKAVIDKEGVMRFQIKNLDAKQLLGISSQILSIVQNHVAKTDERQAAMVAEVNMPLLMLLKFIDTSQATEVLIEEKENG